MNKKPERYERLVRATQRTPMTRKEKWAAFFFFIALPIVLAIIAEYLLNI